MRVQPFVSLGKLLGEIERYISAFPLQLNIELFVREAVTSIGRVNVEVRGLRNECSSRYRSRLVSSVKLKDFIFWFCQTTRADLNIGRWLTIRQKESEGEIDDLLDIGLHLAGGLLSAPDCPASEQKRAIASTPILIRMTSPSYRVERPFKASYEKDVRTQFIGKVRNITAS